MCHFDLAIVSSLYRAEPHYERFVPSVIAAHGELAKSGSVCQHIFIINDASDADWQAMGHIESSAAAHGDKINIQIFSVRREGLYASWNRGVLASDSLAVTFWNADDARHANAMLEGIGRIRSGADIVYFDWVVEKRDRLSGEIRLVPESAPPFDPYLFSKQMLCAHFFMFRRSLFQDVGPFDAQLRIAGDREWCIRAFHRTRKVEHGGLSGGIFADHGIGLSTKNMRALLEEERRINIRHNFWEWIPLWKSGGVRDFRLHEILESENPPLWRPLRPELCLPVVPTPTAIAHFRHRGRLRYRLWTRFLWRFLPRYNLEKLRRRLLKEGFSENPLADSTDGRSS